MNSMPGMFKLFASVTLAVLCFVPIYRSANTPGPRSDSWREEVKSTPKTPRERAPQPIFDEVAAEAGLKFQHYNGMSGKLFLPEIMGSGVALFDFDNDGDLDVFLVQGNVLEPASNPGDTLFPWRGSESQRGRLFRNDLVVAKDGSRTIKFTDVTDKSGIVATGYGMGAAVGDLNNDGRPDLY